MSTTPEQADSYLKENALLLADDHRRNCRDETCGVSLVALARLLKMAGFELSGDEMARLM